MFIHTFECCMSKVHRALMEAGLKKTGMSGKTPVGADVGNSAGYWGGGEVVVGMRQGGN